MMPTRWLKPSRVLSIEHFTDFDEFRPSDVLGGGTSTPLEPQKFSLCRAILPLQDGLFVLQRTFARRLEANVGTDEGVGLVIPFDFHSTANGRELDDSAIGLMRGKTPLKAIEPHPNTYLMLRFNSDMRHRGWPDFESGLEFFRVQPELIQSLRTAILDMFCLASASDDPRQFEAQNRPIQETLLAGLDAALTPEDARPRGALFDKHRKLVAHLDEHVSLLGSAPLYSGDLAQAVGVSVRTLQAATRSVHGMSLHHYLRLKRLWSVRKMLLTGGTGLTVKAAALGNGFWHMGDFAREYKSAFGETPSETLARARHR
jgi:AraC-like DNA-binding protein